MKGAWEKWEEGGAGGHFFFCIRRKRSCGCLSLCGAGCEVDSPVCRVFLWRAGESRKMLFRCVLCLLVEEEGGAAA